MSEPVFLDGLIAKRPHEKAPSFVKARLSFKVDDFIKFLQRYQNKGWVNADLKVSKNGKLYAQLDTWKADENQKQNETKTSEPDPADPDDKPF